MSWLWVILISMLPVIELKGGIPLGLTLGLSYMEAFWWAFLGSSLVCIPLLLLSQPFFDWAKEQKYIGGIFRGIEEISRSKAGIDKDNSKQKIGKIVLVFFFSLLPLPGAGVWTASFLAVLMGVKFGWAVLSVVGGNLFDALLVLGLTNLIGKENLDIMLAVLGVIVIVFLIIFFYKVIKVGYSKNNGHSN